MIDPATDLEVSDTNGSDPDLVMQESRGIDRVLCSDLEKFWAGYDATTVAYKFEFNG